MWLTLQILFVFFHVQCIGGQIDGLVVNPEYCSSFNSDGPQRHELLANSSTVHWGYFYNGLKPALIIRSGDEVFVEMVTHHAGDDYDKMIRGDPGVEDIFDWDENGPKISTRGASGRGDGVHILTGPIYVCGAEPGDVLQVDILDLKPRVNPRTGKSFASNAAAWWGFHHRIPFKTGRPHREVVTIYEIETDEEGQGTFAVPVYQFNWLSESYAGPFQPCVPKSGYIPRTVEGREVFWNNEEYLFEGAPLQLGVKCEEGVQQWSGIFYPGLITPHPTGTEDYSIRGKFRIPVEIHPGVLGLAPDWPYPVNAVPPMVTGGNLDNKRITKGTTMYYPVQVEGALLSMGDAHAAQGDSELDGTGIEMSANGVFKVTLRKKEQLGPRLKNLKFPLLETPTSYVVHGFTYLDYLKELEDLHTTIFGLSNLDRAMNIAIENTRDFVMQAFNLTEDQAYTAISCGTDFGVTQVVDGNWGVHTVIPKKLFNFDK